MVLVIALVVAVLDTTLWFADFAGRGDGAASVSVSASAPVRLADAAVITPFAVPVEPPEADAWAPLAESAPVRLEIPSIGVDTALMELGLMADGTLEVPPDGSLAGWFTGAPTPGEMGPAVIAGHVDWLGPGVFHDLSLVAVGDSIVVSRADGSAALFEVTDVGQYAKSAFPTDEVYGPVSFAALRVITCGGVFDDATGHYDDNIVVFAKLVSSGPNPAR